MFPFKSNTTILVIILASNFLLSACSTLTDSSGKGQNSIDGPLENGSEEKSDKSGNELQLIDDGQLKSSFQGVDPMKDIQIDDEIKKAYKKVASLNKSKNYKVAITLLEDVQKKYPQLSGPDYQKARIYFNQGKMEQALAAVDQSLKNNQRNYYSLNLKGIILRELGRFEESRGIYLAAIDVYPPYPNSHLNLGVLADIYMGELPFALIQYKEYMKLVENKDKKVANWIIEIERRIKATQK